jgi:alkanesulfonate monooxygenase SsuD/methylene tetrahydromethanopterin reductase-like flavin-dependent oxidoreductase (luciferase family)
MALVKKSLVLATDVWDTEMLEVAKLAEERGLDRLWTTERPGRDGLIRAAELALSTSTIGIASGIAFSFTRNPVGLAGTVAELRRLSGGRFTLGLGTGTRGVRTRWYGESFEHPGPRLAEYADLVRAALGARSEPVDFAGTYYQVNIPAFELGGDGEAPSPVLVYGSGLNPVMLRIMAGRCDGVAVHPLACATDYLAQVAGPALAEGAAAVGRPLRAAAWQLVAVDDQPSRAAAAARRQLAFYFSTPSYRGVADICGWGEAAQAIREEFVRVGADWDTVGRQVPEEMIDDLCPSGTPDEVAKKIGKRIETLDRYGFDEIVLEPSVIGSPRSEVISSFRMAVLSAAG